MRKLGLIIKREYLRNLRRPAFLFAAFGTPAIIVGLWIAIFFFLGGDDEERDFSQLGFVNNTETLALPDETSIELGDGDDAITYTLAAFPDEDSARAALDANEDTDGAQGIAAYFVVTQDYRSTGNVQRFSYGEAPVDVDQAFERVLLDALRTELGIALPVERLAQPRENQALIIQSSGREITENTLPVLLLTPIFFAIIFTLSAQTTSTFLVNGLVEEKTNRIMEIMVTTVSPFQLLLGKIIGLGLLGLTQVTVWVLLGVGVFTVGAELELLSVFADAEFPVDLIVVGVVYFVLGYFFLASILSGIGVLAGSEQQGNQYATFISLGGYFVVIALIVTFITDPNGTVPVILSLVPFTAPMAMVIRVGFAAIPAWQFVASISIFIVSIIFVSWASAKVFRWGLLMYGKQLKPKDILAVIFGNREMGTTSEQLNRQEASA